MPSAAPMRFVLVALACFAGAQTGCTIAGAAIGASVPRYESSGWPQSEPRPGASVRVRMRSIDADSSTSSTVDGTYVGIRRSALVVLQDGRENELPLRDVVDVEEREGSEWKEGLLLGAITDACIAAALIAASSSGPISISTDAFH